MDDEPLYPFGYYQLHKVRHSDLRLSRPDLDAADDEPVRVSVQVKIPVSWLAMNVQLYEDLEASVTVPK